MFVLLLYECAALLDTKLQGAKWSGMSLIWENIGLIFIISLCHHKIAYFKLYRR